MTRSTRPKVRINSRKVRTEGDSGPVDRGLGLKTLAGYQIRHGESTATARAVEALPGGLGFVEGPVLGIYLHGLFEQPALLSALFGESPTRSLDDAFEELADAAEEYLDVSALLTKVGIG